MASHDMSRLIVAIFEAWCLKPLCIYLKPEWSICDKFRQEGVFRGNHTHGTTCGANRNTAAYDNGTIIFGFNDHALEHSNPTSTISSPTLTTSHLSPVLSPFSTSSLGSTIGFIFLLLLVSFVSYRVSKHVQECFKSVIDILKFRSDSVYAKLKFEIQTLDYHVYDYIKSQMHPINQMANGVGPMFVLLHFAEDEWTNFLARFSVLEDLLVAERSYTGRHLSTQGPETTRIQSQIAQLEAENSNLESEAAQFSIDKATLHKRIIALDVKNNASDIEVAELKSHIAQLLESNKSIQEELLSIRRDQLTAQKLGATRSDSIDATLKTLIDLAEQASKTSADCKRLGVDSSPVKNATADASSQTSSITSIISTPFSSKTDIPPSSDPDTTSTPNFDIPPSSDPDTTSPRNFDTQSSSNPDITSSSSDPDIPPSSDPDTTSTHNFDTQPPFRPNTTSSFERNIRSSSEPDLSKTHITNNSHSFAIETSRSSIVDKPNSESTDNLVSSVSYVNDPSIAQPQVLIVQDLDWPTLSASIEQSRGSKSDTKHMSLEKELATSTAVDTTVHDKAKASELKPTDAKTNVSTSFEKFKQKATIVPNSPAGGTSSFHNNEPPETLWCGRCKTRKHSEADCCADHQCQACGRFGHIEAHCASSKRPCSWCKRPGHINSRCPDCRMNTGPVYDSSKVWTTGGRKTNGE
ncbi:MAG: hypothetical protein M1828_005529 [Chrysothrix sp. TS-e1954]|nr:MAG: hypothetical protein M1828_005529 [Chrysothrix sp. TS-e1954]